MTDEHRSRGRPKRFDGDESQNIIQSLDRAIDVLETLAEGGAMTLSQIAANMGQSPATIYRVLSTFRLRGMAEVNPASQEWSIGAEAFRIGSAFLRRSNLITRAMPVMQQLRDQTGETSNLGIERDDNVVFVAQVETHESIRAFFPPGTQAPMHASGIGKTLLAMHSEKHLARYLANTPLPSFTQNTICTAEGLREELALIRVQGFSFDDEEKAIGMRCIAAPILNFHGEAVGGISISGPSHRLPPEQTAAIGKLIQQAGEQVSASLGAQPIPTDAAR
ncbi:IclR family transcriptional regulator [Pseudorhodobacter turbinis]|uniref:IclR family transcriptional regulator n=1 Tax=Pseudorhodobacter turbinis TaxID=2500533 RepID=A0A4P8EFR6_9RHOB|nr:HTH-type transcriptional regulator BhcR [Pseudorhodobacter turbinis]QCO55716.1 IclR family transcriptional regulator [Pseudorhodobacter turbinis]